MEDFTDLNIRLSVNTSDNAPAKEFFVPVLKRSVRFDVAIGYFTTNWIRDVAEGFGEFAFRGGRCRWIISPELQENDWKVLRDCSSSDAETIIREKLYKDAADLCEALESDTRTALSWLIKDKLFQFKIGVPDNQLGGMLHSKIGIFEDAKGNKIAFSGSYNLTAHAATNWETIELFSTLRAGDAERVEEKSRILERMWEQQDANLRVFEPTDRELEPFIRVTNNTRRPARRSEPRQRLKIPSHFLSPDEKLRPHQELAITNWFQNKGRGIFNMATGSGKTVTALATAVKLANGLIERDQQLAIFILVPLRHLAEQWKVEANAFCFEPVMCFGDYPGWRQELSESLSGLNEGREKCTCAIVVNATLTSGDFGHYFSLFNGNILIVADEMHNLGSTKSQQALPGEANFRLGLSATPQRHFDEEGTSALESYFGDEVITYGIEDAIRDGTLVPYYYYPKLVYLTDQEQEEYDELSSRISTEMAFNKDEPSEKLKFLLFRRARLLGEAENKLPLLRELLQESRESLYNLVYVGDGTVEEERQVDKVLSIVGNDVRMRARKFTAEETLAERAKILKEFTEGELQAIIAIRCLDEGVDVPRTESAYILASSKNPRQFIQRRGRVLRRAKGKTAARIFDFIVIPNDSRDGDDTEPKSHRNLLKGELLRVVEFAKSALNGPEAQAELREIVLKYDLLDV